jgi:broad specificity phosphatase PhoE
MSPNVSYCTSARSRRILYSTGSYHVQQCGASAQVSNPDHKASHDTLVALTTVYFIRHGQAGSRQDYDRLSDVGREQADRLGAWLARQPVVFDAAWSGRLNRQRETAERVRAACLRSGADFPEIAVHGCWDEFDLDAVYRGIGPQIARHDSEFRLQFEELQEQAMDAHSRVHRTWAQCDTTIVRAWIDNAYDFEGESFEAFVRRVRGGAELFDASLETPMRKVAVFTSATPTAVWAAMALELDGRKIMQLAGVTYNTAITVLRVDPERVRLFQFNTVPHIETPELLTHR